MTTPQLTFGADRPAIHYRTTGQEAAGYKPSYPGRGNSIFCDARARNNRCGYGPYGPSMPRQMDRIQNAWQRVTQGFDNLFRGSSSKQEIRQTKKEAKAELRERFRSGEISRQEYRALKKELRQAKRRAKQNL